MENGENLGTWVSRQRRNRSQLSSEQVGRLDSLGFIWDVLTNQWEAGYKALKLFHSKSGHCHVPQNYLSSGLRLGIWTSSQRRNKKLLTQERVKRLDDLGFIWDPVAEQWDKAFNELMDFHAKRGHCRVAPNLIKNGVSLGQWVLRQRANKDELTRERVKRLESIGFSWDAYADKWEEAFSELKKYFEDKGHTQVPALYEVEGLKLGAWVGTQRRTKDQLTAERIERLNALDFSWDPLLDSWEEAFRALQEFKNREGHSRVAINLKVDGLKLGTWVSRQRQMKDKLTPDRVKRLEALGFCWDTASAQWEVFYMALKQFRKREGHCQVARNFIENDLKLGVWTNNQRYKKHKLNPEQILRLDELQFIWRK
jgi:hypothetical protein